MPLSSDEVRASLERFKRTAQWLAESTGYKAPTIYNAISSGRYTDRMEEAIRRAFAEEERRSSVDIQKPESSVWELVYFNGKELHTIERAKKAGGYEDTETFFHDAVISYADSLLAAEAAQESETAAPENPHLKVADDIAPFVKKKRASGGGN